MKLAAYGVTGVLVLLAEALHTLGDIVTSGFLLLVNPLAATAVATLIAATAAGLLRDNACTLLGRSPGPEFLDRVERIAPSVDGVVGVHALRAESVGPDALHAGMHIEVRTDLSVAEGNAIAREVCRRIEAETDCASCVIHGDPATTETGAETPGDAPARRRAGAWDAPVPNSA